MSRATIHPVVLRGGLLREVLGTVVHVLLPLAIGGSLYVLYRPRSLVMFRWFDQLGLGSIVDRLRAATAVPEGAIPEVIVFCLPNALWLYAFVFQIAQLWKGEGGRPARLWLAAPMLLGIGPELGQLAGVVPGTFDILDVATSVVAASAALVAAGSRRSKP
jgi:hypothetical protein